MARPTSRPTYRPTSRPTYLQDAAHSSQGLSADLVLQALTSNAKLCYLILVRHQLDKPTSAGLAVREWCGSTGKAHPLLAVPDLGSCASLGRRWWRRVPRCSQGERPCHWPPSHCRGCLN